MYVIGEFKEKEAVQNAIVKLRADGVSQDDLALFSEEPVEMPRRVLNRKSHMSLLAVLGAILGGTLATAGVYWAQHNYEVVTGGMPVFSFWATGVITYEMTMMGAIISTFVVFLWESGLIRKKKANAPVPEVLPEYMCLRARVPAENAAHTTETMLTAGAIGILQRIER